MFPTARRLLAFLSILPALILATGLPQSASAQIPYASLLFSEPRYAAIVVDANTGEVLYEKHADATRYPASITKLMTLYLTFEALSTGKLSLTDRVPVSAHAASVAPTKLGVRAGDSVSVDEAVRAAAVKSANDMAVALAEKVGGSESRFATLMTLRAQELGMTHTQFVNASGLPDSRQLSSARDIAILSRAIMRDFPQYYPYFNIRQFPFRGQVVHGHNHVLDSLVGADGLKTGYTSASGFNIAVSAVQNGRRLIGVVLGGPSIVSRDENVEELLTTGFDVMRRRGLGENITIAQNLFESEPSGPIMRPPTEQGDADQRSVKIVMNDVDGRPITPGFQAVQFRPAVESCAAHKVVKYVKGRHGRRTKVVTTSRACSGGLTRVSEPASCAHGRHHKAHACDSHRTQVADRRASHKKHGHVAKVSYKGSTRRANGRVSD